MVSPITSVRLVDGQSFSDKSYSPSPIEMSINLAPYVSNISISGIQHALVGNMACEAFLGMALLSIRLGFNGLSLGSGCGKSVSGYQKICVIGSK